MLTSGILYKVPIDKLRARENRWLNLPKPQAQDTGKLVVELVETTS
jgi:hypothetical protein